MAATPSGRYRPPFPPRPVGGAAASAGAAKETGFAFANPAAREAWYRAAYNQAVNPETWMLGEPMDAATRAAIELGIAGATPPHYQGPDGRHYFHNARTLEDATTRAHRAGHVAGKTMDEIAAEAAGPQGMPGTDAYVAWRLGKATPPGAANDNAAPPVAAKPVAEKSQAANPAVTNPARSQPAPAGPPAANDNRPATPRPIGRHASAGPVSSGSGPRIVNGRVAGMAEAATRPGITLEEFAQAADDYVRLGALGLTGGYADDVSAGLNAFFDMLGGANLAEAFAANQAAERQRTAAARERRGTAGAIVEAAPTFLPGVGDAAGLLADFRDYLENGDQWTADDWALVAAGLVPGAPNRKTVKTGKGVIDDLRRRNDDAYLGQTRPRNLDEYIPGGNIEEYSVSEALALKGKNRGLIYVAEGNLGSKDAQRFQDLTSGSHSSVRLQRRVVPALRYDNPDGYNFIKLDGIEKSPSGDLLLLIDAKKALPLRNPEAMSDLADRLVLLRSALKQNIEEYGDLFQVVYEFPTEELALEAEAYLRKAGYLDIISVRVR